MPAPGLRPRLTAPCRRALVAYGTRPELIKLAPVVAALEGRAVEVVLVDTAQHYSDALNRDIRMSLAVRDPDFALGVGSAPAPEQVARVIAGIGEVVEKIRPDVVVCQGDTNSVLGIALGAAAAEVPVGHVEAGLRSFDWRMPEERNRVLADHIAGHLWAPTAVAAGNLAREGLPEEQVLVTGNTVVDVVLAEMAAAPPQDALLGDLPERFILATIHRPENTDDPAALATLLAALAGAPLPVVFPLHPRTRIAAETAGCESMLASANVRVIDPVDFRVLQALEARCALIVSDSGGLQEEASVHKRPIIVPRRSTERPEVLGTFATLVTDNTELAGAIAETCSHLDEVLKRLAEEPSPYGDGRAGERIAAALVLEPFAASERGSSPDTGTDGISAAAARTPSGTVLRS